MPIALAVVAVLVLGGALMWLRGWDGSVGSREFAPGDRATVGGLTFAIPSGHVGSMTRFIDTPDWIPFRAARIQPPPNELLIVTALDASGGRTILLASTYHRDAAPVAVSDMPTISQSPATKIRAGENTVIVEATGHDGPVYMLLSADGDDALEAVRRLWDLLSIEGAGRP